MLEKVKKDILNLRIRRIEREAWGWVQWASMHISNLGTYLLKVSMQLALTIKHFFISNQKLTMRLKSWLLNVGKLLISMGRGSVTLTLWLLLLMLVVGLFVLALLPALSLFVLMYIPTKLYQVLIKSETNS